jgi:uncharacterized iron-regulated membrane protein
MRLRPLIFWCHLAAAVIAAAVIILMCVTGVALTYERQLIAWADRGARSTTPSGSKVTPLALSDLLETVRAQDPSLALPASVTVAADRLAPVVIGAGPRTVLVDAYSGHILGDSAPATRRFMAGARAWHRWLARDGGGRDTARLVTGSANLLFLAIIVSGLYLWMPRRWTWRHLRAVLFFARHATGRARDFNWHHVIGIWSAVPLFIVVLSAVPMSFQWANGLVYGLAGESAPTAGSVEVRRIGGDRSERAAARDVHRRAMATSIRHCAALLRACRDGEPCRCGFRRRRRPRSCSPSIAALAASRSGARR